jgi:CheR methyltransferase, SAM binding domain
VAAREKAPHIEWHVGDLSGFDLGLSDRSFVPFDLVVAAGNVMIFMDPGTESAALLQMAEHLRPGGFLVAGFQLGSTRFGLADYDAACAAAGLVPVGRYATWDGDRFDGGDYAVSVSQNP